MILSNFREGSKVIISFEPFLPKSRNFTLLKLIFDFCLPFSNLIIDVISGFYLYFYCRVF